MPGKSSTGYAVPPPDPSGLIAWPDDFGQRFSIFVDTEEEFDWEAPLRRGGHGLGAVAALPAAHRRFADRGVPLTYLIDYPIAIDPHAAAILRTFVADGEAAIGAQLHAWVTPPFDEALTPANSYAGNLASTLEAAKLDTLTSAIADAFGTRPLAFRAGRYGIGPRTAALLAERGYRLDSSMRARYDYTADGGPDFRAVGSHAFRLGPLLELPLTTVFTGALRRWGVGLHPVLGAIPMGRGMFARAGLLSRVALTPEDMPLADALEAIAVALGEGVRLLNFSFHSPSLEPGHTPYVRDAADLAAFHRWWDAVLDTLDRRGVRPVSLDAILSAAGLPAR